ncbi:MAG: hypothetical protein EZS28_050219, partial [Streblomastix strix]
DQKMRIDIIGYLKILTKDADEKIRNNAEWALKRLAQCSGNRNEIEKGGYVIMYDKKGD